MENQETVNENSQEQENKPTTFQEWLDNKYPTKQDKEKVKEIDIRKINQERKNQNVVEKLEGKLLDLSNYSNLETVWIRGEGLKFPLTNLNVNDCENLIWLDLRNNHLTVIDLSSCINLKVFQCVGNLLASLDLTNNYQLDELWLRNNNFSEQNLTFVSHLVNLKGLSLGSYDRTRIQQDIYNRFHGSFETLKNLIKLDRLYVRNTDITEGLEYLSNNLRDFYCSTKERPKAKIKVLEQELRKFGEPNNYNFAGLLKDWKTRKKEFTDSPAQQWLEKWYPEERECQRMTADEGWDGSYGWLNEHKRREQIVQLDINNQKLKGGLRLKGFTNLEKLNCSENHLTNLDLNDCSKLIGLKCDQNSLHNLALFQTIDKLKILLVQNNPNLSRDLKIFIPFKKLTHLDISNCPFGGSLEPLKHLNKLEILNISNTNLREGLEYLPISCKKVYCNSSYPCQSTKFMEELDKSRCLVEEESNRYYEIDKWRIDQANNKTASAIPLERLFVIRGNLKQFINKWGKEPDINWLEKPYYIVTRKLPANDLEKLQSLGQYNKYWGITTGIQWINRAASIAGGSLLLINADEYAKVGGAIAIASPFVETVASYLDDKIYSAKETKWSEFLTDADTFSDNFNELLGMTKAIKFDSELGEINKEFGNLKNKIERFLEDYDEDKNQEIDLGELTNENNRAMLAKDLSNKEESKLQEIIDTMKQLEKKVIAYRQGDKKEVVQTELENEEVNLAQQIKEKVKQIKDQETKQKEALEAQSSNYQQIKNQLTEEKNALSLLKERKQLTREEEKLLSGKIEKLGKALLEAKKKIDEAKKEQRQGISSVSVENQPEHSTVDIIENYEVNQFKTSSSANLLDKSKQKEGGIEMQNLGNEQTPQIIQPTHNN